MGSESVPSLRGNRPANEAAERLREWFGTMGADVVLYEGVERIGSPSSLLDEALRHAQSEVFVARDISQMEAEWACLVGRVAEERDLARQHISECCGHALDEVGVADHD